MIRPVAIVRYERLYWAAFILDTVVAAMTWTQREAIVTAYPVLAKATWILPTFQAIGIAVTVLLWYFTARAPSVVAKWVVVILAALSTWAAVHLFRPGSKAWFGQDDDADFDTDTERGNVA